MGLPAKSLFPNSLTDADIATNIVVHALKQGIGKFRKTKTDKYFVKYIIRCSCGGRTRTCDLQVMSLASYQLLHSAMLIFNSLAPHF